MTPLYAGLMCTLLLTGTVAGLFGCMSAVRCHRPFVFAICLTIVSLDFAALAMLLSRLPESAALSPSPWTAAALLLTVLSLSSLLLLRRKSRRQLSPVSIKESCDHLPSALCFAWENGLPCLKNLKMDELSHLLTGEALLNANVFWKAIESQPIVTLENGQTWSFERVQMEMAGKSIYQITGTNITEEARLQREVEKDNLRLKGMNRRLRQYGQDVQEATREKEILRAKTRVHDQIGRALLQTRQFLSGAQGDAESVCAAWRQNVRLLLGKYADEQPVDTFDPLSPPRRAVNFAVRLKGRLIGEVVLYNPDFRGGFEQGCRIAPEYAGHGYGAEAFAAAADWALYHLGLARVVAKCFKENEPSRKMLSACMRPSGEDDTYFYFEKTV